jgi:hypothetical protein
MNHAPRTRVRTILAALVALVATALIAVPAAQASSSQFSIIDAGGLVMNDNTRAAALDQIRSMGTRDVRVVVYWRGIAPNPDSPTPPGIDETDPNAYPAEGWVSYDRLLADARARGISVHLTITGPAPNWAMNGRVPSAARFRSFVTAVGRRYGNQPKTWSMWNEPNQNFFLSPQYKRVGKRKVPAAPAVYRQLFIQGRNGLNAAGLRREPVLFGELAPRAGGSIPPLQFIREVLCLNAKYKRNGKKCAKLKANGFAYHVYVNRRGPYEASKGDIVNLNALRRLTRALDLGARAGRINRGLGIYVTEAGVITRPRIDGASLADQATYMGTAERIAAGNPRVRAYAQYLLDDPPLDGSAGAFITGLRRFGGAPKPALEAWRLPLSALRVSRTRVSIWGVVRPARANRQRARVTLQQRDGRTWKTVKRLTTSRTGTYTTVARYRKGRQFRVIALGVTGPAVKILTARAPQR